MSLSADKQQQKTLTYVVSMGDVDGGETVRLESTLISDK